MVLSLFFLVIISVIGAKLEIHIEGKDGWAKNLPTWHIQNKWTAIVFGRLPLTGYHLYMNLFVLVFLHFPFFFGLNWTLFSEFKILSLYFLFWMIEDFLWFVLNPHFGIGKFKKGNTPWQQDWFCGLPVPYYKFIFMVILFYVLSLNVGM